MSEQEKKSGGTAMDSTVVMVEKTTGSRHKQQPYRPNELQDASDLHHKHSPKAPVVPSVVEELKNVTEDSPTNENAEVEERSDYGHAISSEKHKHSVAKKLSTSTKRREPSPESIALKSLEVDKKKTPLQPIPPQKPSDIAAADKDALKKADEDSITDEITDLRSPEEGKEHSGWTTSSESKKKEIWNDTDDQQNVVLEGIETRSQAWMLDRKASIGPCHRSCLPHKGPSGIMICLPKKSTKCFEQPSGISINISGKCMENMTFVNEIKKSKSEKLKTQMDNLEKVKCSERLPLHVENIKRKLDNLHMKMRSVFHI